MCLVASCYWARIPRLLYAATSHDVATHGFEDLQIYRELTLPAPKRAIDEIAVDGLIKADAVAVLKQWSDALPEPVVPKF